MSLPFSESQLVVVNNLLRRNRERERKRERER